MALKLPATPPASKVCKISTVYDDLGETMGSVNSGIGLRLSEGEMFEVAGNCAEKGASLRRTRRNTISRSDVISKASVADGDMRVQAVKKIAELNVSCNAVVKPP